MAELCFVPPVPHLLLADRLQSLQVVLVQVLFFAGVLPQALRPGRSPWLWCTTSLEFPSVEGGSYDSYNLINMHRVAGSMILVEIAPCDFFSNWFAQL